MTNIDALIKRALGRMRDRLAIDLQESDPQFDTSPIMQHNISFPVSFKWDHCRANFMISAEQTAHARYISWYHTELDKGLKHSLSDHDSDSNYVYSGTSQGDGDSVDDGPSFNTRARKKQRIAQAGDSVTV